jgi:hypothetical protein
MIQAAIRPGLVLPLFAQLTAPNRACSPPRPQIVVACV